MQWDDIEDICQVLSEQEPPVDPRGLSEAEIVALVRELPGFESDIGCFNAGHIEVIRAGVWWGST